MVSTTALLSAAAFAVSVRAGTNTVISNCDFDVYLWSVANVADVAMHTLNSGNPTWSETQYTNPDGGGISVKLSVTTTQANVTQLEYTLGDNQLFYDMSAIDGVGLSSSGLVLAPSDPSCQSVTCPAGQVCDAAYLHPDDVRTLGCNGDVDLTLTLCSGGNSGSSSPAASSQAAPSSSAAPSSTQAPTTTSQAPTTTSQAAPTTLVATTSSTPTVSAAEMFESASPSASVKTWHAVGQHPRHVHGHRFARPRP